MFRKQSFRTVCKWALYSVLLLLAYLIQTTRGLCIPIFGAKPLLIISVMISVAFLESVLSSCVFAFFAGLLMDYASGTLFGYFAFFFILTALVVSLMTHWIALPNFFTFLLYGSIAVLLLGHVDFLFRYALLEQVGTGTFYATVFLPVLLYTLVMTWLVFLLIRWIAFRLFRKRSGVRS